MSSRRGACGTRLRVRRGVGSVEGAGVRRRALGEEGATAGRTPHRVRLRILGGRVTNEGVIFNLHARFSQKNRLHVTALSKA